MACERIYINDLPSDADQAKVKDIFGPYGTVTFVKVLPPRTAGEKSCAIVGFSTVDEATWLVENLDGNIPEGLMEPIKISYAKSSGGDAGGGGWGKAAGGKEAGGKGGGGGWGKGGGGGCGGPYGKGGVGMMGGKGGGKGEYDMAQFLNMAGQSVWQAAGLAGSKAVPDEQQVYICGLAKDCTDFDLYKLMAPYGAIAPRGVKAMLEPDGTCKGIGFVDFMDVAGAQNCVQSLNSFPTPDGRSLYLKTKQPKKAEAPL